MTDYIDDLVDRYDGDLNKATDHEIAEAYADWYAVHRPKEMHDVLDFEDDPYPLILDLIFLWEDPAESRNQLIKMIVKEYGDWIIDKAEEIAA